MIQNNRSGWGTKEGGRGKGGFGADNEVGFSQLAARAFLWGHQRSEREFR